MTGLAFPHARSFRSLRAVTIRHLTLVLVVAFNCIGCCRGYAQLKACGLAPSPRSILP
jgi:hypothetical protein